MSLNSSDGSYSSSWYLAVCRLVNEMEESKVLHNRKNPNVDITEWLLVDRINPNKVTNTDMEYLHVNLNQDIHMEKLYMMTLQTAFFWIGPSW